LERAFLAFGKIELHAKCVEQHRAHDETKGRCRERKDARREESVLLIYDEWSTNGRSVLREALRPFPLFRGHPNGL
jgi:hypothetical protein